MKNDSKIYVVEWQGAHRKRVSDETTELSNVMEF
jgi:hypothetical protein